MRLHLRGLRQCHRAEKRGAAQSLHPGRQGNHPHAQDALCRVRRAAGRGQGAGRRSAATGSTDAAAAPSAPSRDNPAEIAFCRARAPQQAGIEQGNLAHRSRSRPAPVSTTRSATRSASFRATIRRWSMPSSPRSAYRPISRSAAARCREVLSDGVSLGLAPDMLFQLFSYITGGERRQKAKALASGGDPDGDAATLDVLAALQKFPRHPARPRSLRRGARSAAAAALFDRVVAQGRRRAGVSLTIDAVRYAIGKRERLGVASTFFAERIAPGDAAEGLCAEGPRLRPAGRPVGADHHDRPRHRHRAVPRLPARTHGDQGAGPQLAVLRPSAPRLRFLLRGRTGRHASRRRADAAVAGLVARRRPRNSTCRTACARSAAICGPGSRTARMSMFAAPSPWRKDVERALVDVIAAHGARTHRSGGGVSRRAEERAGRYQADVY